MLPGTTISVAGNTAHQLGVAILAQTYQVGQVHVIAQRCLFVSIPQMEVVARILVADGTIVLEKFAMHLLLRQRIDLSRLSKDAY